MSRVGETDTAYGGRDAGFLVTAEASWTDPAQTDEAIAWGREVWDALEHALDRRRSTSTSPGSARRRTSSSAPATAPTTSGSPSSRRSTTRTTCSG